MVNKILSGSTNKFSGDGMIRSVSSLGLFREVSVSSGKGVASRKVSSLRFCSEYNKDMERIQNKGRFSLKDLSKDRTVPYGPPPGHTPWICKDIKSKAVTSESLTKQTSAELDGL